MGPKHVAYLYTANTYLCMTIVYHINNVIINNLNRISSIKLAVSLHLPRSSKACHLAILTITLNTNFVVNFKLHISRIKAAIYVEFCGET